MILLAALRAAQAAPPAPAPTAEDDIVVIAPTMDALVATGVPWQAGAPKGGH